MTERKYLLRQMKVIICNFQWLFNPDIRFRFLKLLGEDLYKCALIIDECHNILYIVRFVKIGSHVQSVKEDLIPLN